jgi:hypothetical protein
MSHGTDGDGGRVDMRVVHTASGVMEAESIRSMLEAAGIPVELRLEAATRLYAVTVDGLGAVRVAVPADRFDEARVLIETPAELVEDAGAPDREDE